MIPSLKLHHRKLTYLENAGWKTIFPFEIVPFHVTFSFSGRVTANAPKVTNG